MSPKKMEPRSLWRDGTLEEAMRAHCRACVDANGGNMRAAARDLDISHTTLYRILGAQEKKS